MAQGRRGYRLVAGSGKAVRMLAESTDRDGVLAVLDALASGVLAIPDADPDGTRLTLYRNGMVAGQSDYPGVLAVQLRAMPERPAPPTPTDNDPLGLFGPNGSEDGPAPPRSDSASSAKPAASAWYDLSAPTAAPSPGHRRRSRAAPPPGLRGTRRTARRG